MIRIETDDWQLDALPEVGGGIARLTWRGRDILRPSISNPPTARQTGCFPLVPYTNRIAGGRFVFDGQEVVLPKLDPRHDDNAIHGDGWTNAWTVEGVGPGRMTLTYDHPPGQPWPWPYSARQTLSLKGNEATLALEVTNRGTTIMPAGLGFHPYLRRTADSRITARVDGVWLVDGSFIPTEHVAANRVFDWSSGPRLAEAPAVDHAYTRWDGRALLTCDDLTTEITASSNAHWLHIVVPADGTFCCIEPVTHVPAALNHRETFDRSGMVALEPGKTLSLQMTLRPSLTG